MNNDRQKKKKKTGKVWNYSANLGSAALNERLASEIQRWIGLLDLVMKCKKYM